MEQMARMDTDSQFKCTTINYLGKEVLGGQEKMGTVTLEVLTPKPIECNCISMDLQSKNIIFNLSNMTASCY